MSLLDEDRREGLPVARGKLISSVRKFGVNEGEKEEGI
jgi:hypothetical protein